MGMVRVMLSSPASLISVAELDTTVPEAVAPSRSRTVARGAPAGGPESFIAREYSSSDAATISTIRDFIIPASIPRGPPVYPVRESHHGGNPDSARGHW